MSKLNKFFLEKNRIGDTDEDNSQDLVRYKQVIQAFSRCTYSSIYTIDYQKRTFEYVSENPLFLCGHTAEEVEKMGYDFYFKYVPAEDLDLLLTINQVGFDFLDNIAIEERTAYTISYDFHLLPSDGMKILINQKLTPIFLTDSGKIRKALCVVALSTESTAGNIKVYKQWDGKVHTYDLAISKWKSFENTVLSRREKEILQLSIRGYNINDIANSMFISVETVKFHRRKLFKKLQVANISEAIFYAANNKLL